MDKKEERAYELWFEYLKLSKNYKSLCDLIRKGKPLPKKYRPTIGLLGGVILDEKKEWPGHIYETYLTFGDIHSETFESFWKKKKEYFKDHSEDIGVFSLTKLLPMYVDYFKSGFERSKGREPNIDEFVNYLSNPLPDTLLLQIDILSGTAIELGDQVLKHINEAKKAIKETCDRYRWIRCRNKRPTPSVHIKPLRDCLKIYNSYQDGLKPKEILKMYNPEAKYYPQDSIEISRKHGYARRIIANTEIGYFPGDYHSKKK